MDNKNNSKLEAVSNKLIGFANALSIRSQVEKKFQKLAIKPENILQGAVIPYERYASFSERVNAFFLDSLLLILVVFYLLFFWQSVLPKGTSPMEMLDLCEGVSQQECVSKLKDYYSSSSFLAGNLISIIFQVALYGVFFVLFWFKFSATPGKMLFRLKIVDADTYEKPSKTQFLIRFLGYIVALLPFGFGLFAAYFSPRVQGWQDKLANTVVVSKNPINVDRQLKYNLRSTLILIIFLVVILFLLRK